MELSLEALSHGVVHELSTDIEAKILVSDITIELWQSLTPLARNEWICWIEDAKQQKTREKRMNQMLEHLLAGKRRPCCWPGCRHRERTGKA
jgi:uncharacterized protein YdeI (YjbR/CyaY-like superfamily)